MIPKNEPVAGPYKMAQWEKGAFVSHIPNDSYPLKDDVSAFYSNGAFSLENPRTGFRWSIGDTKGDIKIAVTEGPFAKGLRFRILQNQSAAVLSLISGQVDFIMNSLGLQRGFQDQLKKAPNISLIENNVNGFRYMAFNLSRYPYNIKEFRQAVSTLIDREYICDRVLQGVAFPQYSMVPPGNAFWHNPNVKQWGKGMTRSERIAEAVRLLKSAGFKWEVEPEVDIKNDRVLRRGKGLIMPDGRKMPSFDFLIMTAGYDPLRYTFGLNMASWLKEVGIPIEAVPTEFSAVRTATNKRDYDAFMMGWSLGLYPDHMHIFFHSSQAQDGFNYPMYNNPEFDKMAKDFVAEADLETARAKAFKLQEFLAEECPYVVLFDTPLIEAYRSDRVQYQYTKTLSGLQYNGDATATVKVMD
ncbi:MAG: ABC transporter substrate-binding protein [Firmicutes bacterium]|nr:ABC transporter substrate-binding protein [Bacillota bacterium]